MTDQLAETERVKYLDAWAKPEYRAMCHATQLYRTHRHLFPDMAAYKPYRIIDIGCGTGSFMREVMKDGGITAYGIDIAAPECLSEFMQGVTREVYNVAATSVWDWPMWFPVMFDFGVCCDVAEHLPTDKVEQSLANVARYCTTCLWKIAHVPDVCGGGQYHLTVKPREWWLEQMNAIQPGARFECVVERSGYQDSVITWPVPS